MVRHDPDDISDEDFENIVLPCNRKIVDYIKATFLNDFVAYDLAISYNMNAMWDEPFEILINSAIEDLAQVTSSMCDKDKVKNILKEKYKLHVISESPLEIEEISNE